MRRRWRGLAGPGDFGSLKHLGEMAGGNSSRTPLPDWFAGGEGGRSGPFSLSGQLDKSKEKGRVGKAQRLASTLDHRPRIPSPPGRLSHPPQPPAPAFTEAGTRSPDVHIYSRSEHIEGVAGDVVTIR